jgi:hypothetical protein
VVTVVDYAFPLVQPLPVTKQVVFWLLQRVTELPELLAPVERSRSLQG